MLEWIYQIFYFKREPKFSILFTISLKWTKYVEGVPERNVIGIKLKLVLM
jgi:hypothetical protein